MDEERARHAVGRNEHDREDEAAPTAAGKRAQRHGIDQIGHAEDVPSDRSVAASAMGMRGGSASLRKAPGAPSRNTPASQAPRPLPSRRSSATDASSRRAGR